MSCDYCDLYRQQPTGVIRAYLDQDDTEWHLCERCKGNFDAIAELYEHDETTVILRPKEAE